MKTVGTFQKIQDARQPLDALVTCDETTIHGNDESCDAKSATTRSDHILIMLGIITVEVDALAGKSRSGFSTVPHVIEVNTLDIVEHGIIVAEGCGPLFGCLPVLRFRLSACRISAVTLAGDEHQHEC